MTPYKQKMKGPPKQKKIFYIWTAHYRHCSTDGTRDWGKGKCATLLQTWKREKRADEAVDLNGTCKTPERARVCRPLLPLPATWDTSSQ